MSIKFNVNGVAKTTSDIYVGVNGVTRRVVSVLTSANGVRKEIYNYSPSPPVEIVSWADGTDEQIEAMLSAYYNGRLNIYDYWSVGDERTVSLSRVTDVQACESIIPQTITMVLMNRGGKTLKTPIGNKTECAFIVGQKDNMQNTGYINENSSKGNYDGWDACDRRIWCNTAYVTALPLSFSALFKLHYNATSKGTHGHSEIIYSEDYFSLPSEKEVFGTTRYANSTAEAPNSQFEYYVDSTTRAKSARWFLRSPRDNNALAFCNVVGGNPNFASATLKYGISPFGCI